MITEYTLSFSDEDAIDGEYLGVLEIANTANPAIQIKGIAFSKQEIFFKDDLKYRIAAPVLMPSKVFRRDEQTGEEYYLIVTPETVEFAFNKFQRDRAGKDVFNEEHDVTKRVPSYPLEMWLVENPKLDKSFTTYGIECPEKTWFCVQQFTDKDAYNEAIKNGQTGFSIHGDGAVRLSKQETIKTEIMSKPQLKKHKYIARFSEGATTDSGEVIVTTDALEVGAEVVVVDENLEEVAGFTGDVVIDGEPVSIENDAITSIGADTITTDMAEVEIEVEAEPKEEEVAMSTEEVKTEEEVVEMAEGDVAPGYTKEEIDAKFEEIYSMIAELKTPTEGPVAEGEEVQMTEVQMRMNRVSQLAAQYNK
jgi:hypothetical protein